MSPEHTSFPAPHERRPEHSHPSLPESACAETSRVRTTASAHRSLSCRATAPGYEPWGPFYALPGGSQRGTWATRTHWDRTLGDI